MTQKPDAAASNAAPESAALRSERAAQFDATFQREVVCVLGVPVDAISLDEAVSRVRRNGFQGQRCFISTPNLNFAVTASRDATFRDSILHSDLSLVDGMPLVWVARLLGLPVRERVSGADLFDRLSTHPGPPLRVYFFGGPPGAAEQAGERLNQSAAGVRCVGFDSASFGSIDEISADKYIRRINASEAHFVVVALGAQKGQVWIERNRAKLNAPLISHLGAVVNFVAGNLQRAPTLVQRLGLEWLWRIKEQPDLWRRYGRDGTLLLGWACTRVLPHAACLRWRKFRNRAPVSATLTTSHAEGRTVVTLAGDWCNASLGPLRAVLSDAAAGGHSLCLDLRQVTWIDNAFVGLMLLVRGVFDGEQRLSLREPSALVRRIFWFNGAEHLVSAKTPGSSEEGGFGMGTRGQA